MLGLQFGLASVVLIAFAGGYLFRADMLGLQFGLASVVLIAFAGGYLFRLSYGKRACY